MVGVDSLRVQVEFRLIHRRAQLLSKDLLRVFSSLVVHQALQAHHSRIRAVIELSMAIIVPRLGKAFVILPLMKQVPNEDHLLEL